MITYGEEIFANFREEILPLLFTQWEELANHKDTRPLDPDLDKYQRLNDEGVLKCFVVRDDGLLIGYASYLFANNLHYQTWTYADCDVYYLDPRYRKAGVGMQMMVEIEAWLKQLGVKSVVMHDKLNHSHEKLFLALGFNPIEKRYEKVLN